MALGMVLIPMRRMQPQDMFYVVVNMTVITAIFYYNYLKNYNVAITFILQWFLSGLVVKVTQIVTFKQHLDNH